MQVCSRAVVVAMGVNADGRRELLGLKVGDSESEAFWSEFIGSLKERGLSGVKLVISDAHQGLTNAIRRMLGDLLLRNPVAPIVDHLRSDFLQLRDGT